MPKLSKIELDAKKQEGRNLFVKKFDFIQISKLIKVSTRTLSKWSKEEGWEELKKMQDLSISSLKNQILETFHDMKSGRTPKLTSDEISKLASAFEKLSDRKKHLAYMYDSFQELIAELAKEVTLAKGKDKESKLEIYKYIAVLMEKLTSKKYAEALDE